MKRKVLILTAVMLLYMTSAYAQKIQSAHIRSVPISNCAITGKGVSEPINMKRSGRGGSSAGCEGVTNMAVSYTSDCEAKITWTAPTATPPKEVIFTEGFEGTVSGWLVETNTNGDPWAIWVNSPGYEWAHSGTQFAGNFWTEGEARDAWLYSPAIQLTAGKKYTVKFWLRLPGYPSYGEHDYFELKIGQAAASTAMNTTLYNNTTTYIPNYTLITKDFTPTTNGAYYLGFHAFTPTDEGDFILIDDIEVSVEDAGPVQCNIYRDGAKIASNVAGNSYTDKGFNINAGHTWEVKVVCAEGGESPAATVNKGACGTPQGQDAMIINFVDQSNVTNPINTIQRITFTGNNLLLKPTTGTEKSYLLNNITYITFLNQVGIKEHREAIEVEIFINNYGEIVVESPHQIYKLMVLDLLGREVATSTQSKMNVNFLNTGIYILQVATEKGFVGKKFMKN